MGINVREVACPDGVFWLQLQESRVMKKKQKRRFNWILSDVVRKGLKAWYETSARARGKSFYCSALHGESDYNITINSDLTVSCNCQDYDGSGHIGDLKKDSFEQVFFGPVAEHLRTELGKGRLPITTCVRCGDLRRIDKAKIPRGFLDGYTPSRPQNAAAAKTDFPAVRLPYRGMLLENTVNCNIDCLGCDRGSAALIRRQRQMPLEDLARMADLVQELGLQQLFYLNLGEPFLSPNIGQELPLLRAKNPDCRIVISTNGIILNSDVKREAALSASHLFFSIAGVSDDMLKKYEKFGSFEKAYENMKALVDHRNAKGLSKPLIEWKYLLFNWNDQRRTIERAIEMAKEARVDAISFWPTNNPYYGYSWRYRLGMLKDIGEATWKGREVDLRTVREPVVGLGTMPVSFAEAGG
jgi:MoaA/NifB/PqqE/SkfB family radical SAM enzyme